MKINREIYINSTIGSSRAAILENKVLTDLYIDFPDHKKMVGNIYKGKVQNVLPGMQAAFVDIGYNINAFLPFTEISGINSLNNVSFEIEGDKKSNKDKQTNLEIGDEVMVQVIKEPFLGKGPRVTMDISLAGNLIVLVPNQNYIGISKKINDKYERKRLKNVISSFKEKDFGIIVRTISSLKDEKIIKNDYSELKSEWKNINSQFKTSDSCQEIYNDYNFSKIISRDLFTESINNIYIDNKTIHKKVYKSIKGLNPDKIKNIQFYNKKIPIFDNHNIENQISKSLKNKVWLKSGAYLIIDHTEAMVVIDVNSGRFVGKKSHEENSLAINLESAKEIVKQLRIRDIGGLVVIDFIDLANTKNRKKVYEEIKRNLIRDRAKVSISEFSEYGLLQMTRQRIGLSLLYSLTHECKNCKGLGRVESYDFSMTKIENWIKRFKAKHNDKRLITYVNDGMYNYINNNKKKIINTLIFKNWIWIELKIDNSLNSNDFRVYSKKRKKDITNEV
tara:strand:+ start:18313 stop:19827 length:1515 start_codon:yes stop_codon:yes gene_type:complete